MRTTTASAEGARLRRAVVLPIPEPAATLIDEVRARWDPVMRDRIGPHLTLVHEVTDHDAMGDVVVAAAAAVGPFSITLTTAGCWGERPTYGVYLEVDDPTGAIAELHGRLVTFETPAWSRVAFRPHVTLVHGRTVAADRAEPAWAALCELHAGWEVELTALDTLELIEPTGWRSVTRHPLSGGAIGL